MTTLFDASLALAQVVTNVVNSVTTAAGTATTVIDSTRTEAADYWNNGTLFVTSGTHANKTRVITDWALSGTTFTIPTTTTAVGSGATYGVCTADWPRYKLWEFINRALREMGDVPAQDATLTTVADQEQYTLPAGVSDVRLVEVATNTATPYGYQPYSGVWRELPSGILQFDTGRAPVDDGLLIRLTYMDAHATMDDDADTISTYVHLDRVIWTAAAHGWLWRMQMSKEDEPTYTAQLQFAMAQAEKFKRLHPVPYIPRAARLSL